MTVIKNPGENGYTYAEDGTPPALGQALRAFDDAVAALREQYVAAVVAVSEGNIKTPEQAAPEEGVWSCSGCGAWSDQMSAIAEWRHVDGKWEHKCPGEHPQTGHQPARFFRCRRLPFRDGINTGEADIDAVRKERDLLFDALNLQMRSTLLTTEAMERVEAFRVVIAESKEQVRGEIRRLEKGWAAAGEEANLLRAELAAERTRSYQAPMVAQRLAEREDVAPILAKDTEEAQTRVLDQKGQGFSDPSVATRYPCPCSKCTTPKGAPFDEDLGEKDGAR